MKKILTLRKTEGPFYPDKQPLDTDNDLVVVKVSSSFAKTLIFYGNHIKVPVVIKFLKNYGKEAHE